MKAAVQQRARELGFDDCRVAAAAPPEHAVEFEAWLAAGRHGQMGYLQRNAPKRVDPQQVLPGARSILTLAASYAAEAEVQGSRFKVQGSDTPPRAPDLRSAAPQGTGAGNASESSSLPAHFGERERGPDPAATPHASPRTPHVGVVARYARFADYHDVLGGRLRALADFLAQLGGADTRSLWYVDTGPLLERDHAQRAGLGFVGKHTNLITRRLGNWSFLAEILTTLELEPDAPEKNRCGHCTRCLEACPTGAITAPFQLDARLCISYLTIELKGPIPVALRPAVGNRVFGCDDCLAVCPWNRFAQVGRLMKEHSRPELAAPDLIELLCLDEAGFKRRFAGTPLLRIKRRGLLRNVCVALGNVGDRTALVALERAGADPEPLIAEHARWAIERIQHRLATP